jgi:hypothetical protein
MSGINSVIEYSINDGATWHHGRTIEAWVRRDAASLSAQRQAVRENAREQYGNVEHVVTRLMYENDPLCVLSQPASPQVTVTFDSRDAVSIIRALRAAVDPETLRAVAQAELAR